MNALQAQQSNKKITPFQFHVRRIAPDRYTIAVAVNATEITAVTQLPFNKLEQREYQTLLKQTDASSKTRESQYRIREFSQRLFDFLIGDHTEIKTAYDNVHKNTDERLPISVSVDNTRQLTELHWEVMCDSDGDFVGLSQRTSVSRFVPGNPVMRPSPVKLPLKVLVVIPSPPNYAFVDSNHEWEVVNKTLDGLQSSGSLILERFSPPTGTALRRQLRAYDYDIIHFVSPIYFDEAIDEASIAMEERSNSSGSQPLKISQFARELGETTTVRLIIFNLYEATTRELVSVGKHLQEGAAASGIVFAKMNPSAEQLFLKQLYQELCAFQPLDFAVTLARQQVADSFSTFDWIKPMLFSQSPHRHLFRPF